MNTLDANPSQKSARLDDPRTIGSARVTWARKDALRKSLRRRRGAVLALVMGILVIVGIVGAGLLATSGASQIEAVRRQQNLQCFWLAESGLALGRAKLLKDELYRAAPTPLALTSGPYAAYVSVVRSGNVYHVVSIGTSFVARFSRRVSQEFVLESLDYWDDFALMAGPGGVRMAQSVSIYGDVYCGGDVEMSQSAAILETLYCEGNVSLSQSAAIYDQAFVGGSLSLRNSSVHGGSYPFDSPANPYYLNRPRVPEIDWAYYESLLAWASLSDYQGWIAQAASSGQSAWPPSTNLINLAGQTVLVQGNKSVSGKKIISHPPGGKLIVSGSLSLSTVEIGHGLTIASGGHLSVSQSSVITGQVTLASLGNVSLQQTCRGGADVVAIASGDLRLSQSCQMGSGFIGVAGNVIDLGQSCSVASNATLVCGNLFTMGQSAQLGANSVAYASRKIEMKQSGAVAERSALITPGDIELRQSVVARGMVYAGTNLYMSQSAQVQGLAFAGHRAELSQSVTISYDRLRLPNPVPPGINTNAAVRIRPQKWKEH